MAQVDQLTVADKDGVAREVATITALLKLIGEVSATPTSNTLLDRLKKLGDTAAAGANATFTRAANVTPYTDGDLVGAPQQLLAVGDSAGKIHVTGGRLYYNVSAIPAGLTGFRLHLFKSAPSVLQADNDIFDLIANDRDNHAGFMDFTNLKKYGSTIMAQADGVNHQISLTSADLYGVLTSTGGFTPAANSETVKVFIHTLKV